MTRQPNYNSHRTVRPGLLFCPPDYPQIYNRESPICNIVKNCRFAEQKQRRWRESNSWIPPLYPLSTATKMPQADAGNNP